jgi:hypothetical protein
MKKKSKYNVGVIGVSIAVFLFLFLQSAYSQVFEEDPTLSSLEGKIKTYEEQIELKATKAYKDAYVGPLYLLMLSDYIYEPERFGDKIIEPASGIAKIAKNMAEIIKMRIINSTLQFKDEAIKAKMLAYLSDIIKAADIQISYFQKGENRIIDHLDRYKYFHIYEIMEKAEGILGIHIAEGDDGANAAQYGCPFQFLAWSESWSSNTKNEAVCQDCVKAAELTKDLVLQLKKWYLFLWEEGYARVKDEYKDEYKRKKVKEPAYFEPLISQAESLSQYYRTNDKLCLEAANKHRQDAIKKFTDLMVKYAE